MSLQQDSHYPSTIAPAYRGGVFPSPVDQASTAPCRKFRSRSPAHVHPDAKQVRLALSIIDSRNAHAIENSIAGSCACCRRGGARGRRLQQRHPAFCPAMQGGVVRAPGTWDFVDRHAHCGNTTLHQEQGLFGLAARDPQAPVKMATFPTHVGPSDDNGVGWFQATQGGIVRP